MEELILSKARDLFFNYGLKSISMDDLAREVGVSKKTVYQAVADKAELVNKVVAHLVQCHQEKMEQCTALARNAVEEVALQATQSFVPLTTIRYTFFFDLQKFFPEAWQRVVLHRQQHLLPGLMRNLKWGMEEGLYRPDLDLAITAQIRFQQLQSALEPGFFAHFKNNPSQLLEHLTRFYLHAITSSKGSRMIDKYLTEKQSLN